MKNKLIERAKEVVGLFELNGFDGNSAGTVAAAILSKNGSIYTGICIDVACSMGFCAEHSAISEMLKNRETEIDMVVAVTENGKIIPPCGRCREMIFQIDKNNINTKVILSEDSVKELRELLPCTWADIF